MIYKKFHCERSGRMPLNLLINFYIYSSKKAEIAGYNFVESSDAAT